MAKKTYNPIFGKPQQVSLPKVDLQYSTPKKPESEKAEPPKTKPVVPVFSRQTTKANHIVPTNDRQRYQESTRQGYQQALQDNAGARFHAGFMEGLSPVSLQGQIGKQYGQETVDALNNSTAYTVGGAAGTMAQYAILYAGAAPKIGKALSNVPKYTQMGKIGQAVARGVGTDLAVGVPLNTLYGVSKEGLEGKELAKSIGLNTAIDLVAGGLFEIIPAGVKGMKRFVNKQTGEVVAEATDEVVEQAVKYATDFYVDPRGTARSQNVIPALPAPKVDKAQESQRIIDSFNQWRKTNFGGAFGQVSEADMQALKELYFEYTGIDIDRELANLSAIGGVEMPTRTPVNPQNRPVQPQTPSSGVIPNPTNDEAIAKVLTSTDPARRTIKEFGSDVVGQAKRKFVDSGDTVAKIAREVKDDVLYPLYNNAKQSPRRGEHMIGVAQTNLRGEKIGKSLQEIFRPIQAKGDDYYRRFQEYLYHMHNVDRMSIVDNAEKAVREFELRHPELVDIDYKELVKLSKDAEGGSVASEYIKLIDGVKNAKNKPVFGDTITADISRRKASELLQNNPEFANLAEDVYTFNRNNMQYRVEGGLLTKEQADYMLKMYPHYVPTYRIPTSSKGAIAKGNLAEISKTLKKAKGSNKDLIPLHESMARQTMQVVEASNKNVFANRLVDTVGEKTQKYIRDVTPTDEMLDIDLDEIPKLKNHLKLYRDGKAYDVEVDDTLYEALKALSPTKDSNSLVRAATAVNTGFKQLITGWNPIFLIRNGARDIQDVGLYSKNLKEFATKYPTAWKEMTTNGELWQQYKALGGIGSSFFDYAKGFKNDPTWLRANTIDRVEALNLALEQLPRFTEFIAYIAKNGDDYDSLMKAMYNAADVTVNFGRSGTWGKTLNSTFVPFFNPAMQGTSKLIRRFTETKGVKGWTELVIKAAAIGVAPSLLNEMVYTNDPQYNEIPARERDINYIFKVGDNQWVKIPKGRVVSLFGSAAQRLVRMKKGDKDSFAGWVGTMLDQVAPISPTESNILSPIAAVKNNKSWYGTPIEPRRLEKYAPGKRADERTTVVAKWLGDKLGYSPKKIDYLFDAYTGVIGDIAIPLMTPSAERDPITKAFTIDSVTTNEVPQKFYDKLDEVYYAKNEPGSDVSYDIMYRYMNKQNTLVADLSSQMREIDGSNMDDKTKKEKIRELKDLSNGIQRTALETLWQVEKATKQLSKTIKDPEILYREVNKEVFGAEYALRTWDKRVHEKASKYIKDGVTYDVYYDVYFKTKDIQSDKDKNGNSISAGSKFEYNGTGKSASLKKKEVIDSIKGLSEKDRRSLYEAFDVSDKVAKRIIVPVKK